MGVQDCGRVRVLIGFLKELDRVGWVLRYPTGDRFRV